MEIVKLIVQILLFLSYICKEDYKLKIEIKKENRVKDYKEKQ